MPLHQWQALHGAAVEGPDIHSHYLIELRIGNVPGRLTSGQGGEQRGVVDKDVQAPPALVDLVHHGTNAVPAGHVQICGQDAAVMLLGQALGGLRHARRVDVCYHHRRSSLGQRLGVKHADAFGASSNDGDLAVQPEEVESSVHGIALLSLSAGGYAARASRRHRDYASSVGTCTSPLQKSCNVCIGNPAALQYTARPVDLVWSMVMA